MTPSAAATGDAPWREELLALVRAASGGLLFGVPLLYTMEMWWIGGHTAPTEMLLVLGLLAVPLFALNSTAGFRKIRDVWVVEALADVVKALAVGLVVTTTVLVLLRQITLDTPLVAGLGRIVIQCIPFCLGVGVARLLLQGDPSLAGDDDGDGGSDRSSRSDDVVHGSAADLGATALGAAFVGLSIAPTDEVPMLAATMDPAWQVLLVAASLLASHAAVFVAGFAGQDRRHRQEGVFQRPVTETLVTYLVALAVSVVLLWAFQRGLTPLDDLLARVVVLGFPAAIGGAVGRLAL